MSTDLNDWLRSGQYLPKPLRDFHDQKETFKAIDGVAQRSIAAGNADIKDVSWRAGHIYSIDIFLWFMAKHGWTLQRSRTRLPFASLDDRLKAEREAQLDAMASILEQPHD